MYCTSLHTPPDNCGTRAAVEAKLHISAHQADWQEVTTGHIIGVEQRAVRIGRLEGHLELHEGQVVVGGLRPGGAGVRVHALVKLGQGQQETWNERC